MKRLLLALAATLAVAGAHAQATPAGLWKTIDDSTKKERSLVRIVETDGVVSGKLEKLLDPEAKQDAVCDECSDDRKGQPLVGLSIIRGAKKSADTDGLWDGGTILDPANGKTYKLRLKPIDGGKKLEVRGYVGAPLFGRTQTWIRVE
jgi:uncharacterized protein (DUF2147 family)